MNSHFSFLESKSYVINLLKEYPIQAVGVMAASTALYALYSSSKDKEYDGYDKIPIPKGKYPYFGHIPYLSENPIYKLYEWHKELGSIIQVKMGVQDFVFISDPVLAHEVFVHNNKITFSRPPNAFGDKYHSLGGRGMGFALNRKKAKESKLAAISILAPKVVDKMADALQLETNYLVDQLIKGGSSNEGVYPFHDIVFRSLNIILGVCLDARLDSKDDPTYKSIVDIIRLSLFYGGVDDNIDAYIPAFSFIGYLKDNDKKRHNFIENIRNPVLRKLIDEALEKDKDCMVKRMKNSEIKNMYDKDDMLVLFTDFLLAGTDSVSVTISRAFLVLSHYPEVQKKISSEVDAFITKHKRLPTFSEREAFPYMISVQREVMRLYPVTPYGLPHMAEEDFVVNNYIIKKGTTLISDMYSIHRNPDVYPDPEKFIPERFINNTSTLHASANRNVKERDQFNFGWGKRMCSGIHLAETEMFLTYTTLLARCTIEPALDSNGSPVYGEIDGFVNGGVVLNSKPYKVRFVERPDGLL